MEAHSSSDSEFFTAFDAIIIDMRPAPFMGATDQKRAESSSFAKGRLGAESGYRVTEMTDY
jgi:hypothetical protein